MTSVQNQPSPESGKKPYSRPSLVVYGHVAKLTQGSSQRSGESGNTKTKNA